MFGKTLKSYEHVHISSKSPKISNKNRDIEGLLNFLTSRIEEIIDFG